MTKGQVEDAERFALNEFDKWNDVTGFVEPNTGYYYELQSVIKDAVHIGIHMNNAGEVFRKPDGSINRMSDDPRF